jgi:hypothetical protein
MLFGALSCNVAWGLVDAVMYVMMARTDRDRALLSSILFADQKMRAKAVIANSCLLLCPCCRPTKWKRSGKGYCSCLNQNTMGKNLKILK